MGRFSSVLDLRCESGDLRLRPGTLVVIVQTPLAPLAGEVSRLAPFGRFGLSPSLSLLLESSSLELSLEEL